MADVTVIYSGTGALPFTPVSFNSESDGPAVLCLAGSCWAGGGNTGMIGFDVLIDGNVVTRLSVYTNETASHKALVPQWAPVKLSIGAHTLSLRPFNAYTTVDGNDNFQFVLWY